MTDRSGGVREAALVWGWRRKPTGRRWAPCGVCIGWVSGSDLYLEPLASYQVAQQFAGIERLPVSEQTLRRRLHVRGLLASIDAGRQMLLVRRTLQSRPRQVLHLKVSDLLGAITKTGVNFVP